MPTMIVYAMIRLWHRLMERSKTMNKITDKILHNKVRRIKRSDRFRDYRIEFVPLPQYPMCDTVYDMPLHTIWINTAADPDANVSKLNCEQW